MYWYFQCTEFTTQDSQNGVKYLGQKTSFTQSYLLTTIIIYIKYNNKIYNWRENYFLNN